MSRLQLWRRKGLAPLLTLPVPEGPLRRPWVKRRGEAFTRQPAAAESDGSEGANDANRELQRNECPRSISDYLLPQSLARRPGCSPVGVRVRPGWRRDVDREPQPVRRSALPGF